MDNFKPIFALAMILGLGLGLIRVADARPTVLAYAGFPWDTSTQVGVQLLVNGTYTYTNEWGDPATCSNKLAQMQAAGVEGIILDLSNWGSGGNYGNGRIYTQTSRMTNIVAQCARVGMLHCSMFRAQTNVSTTAVDIPTFNSHASWIWSNELHNANGTLNTNYFQYLGKPLIIVYQPDLATFTNAWAAAAASDKNWLTNFTTGSCFGTNIAWQAGSGWGWNYNQSNWNNSMRSVCPYTNQAGCTGVWTDCRWKDTGVGWTQSLQWGLDASNVCVLASFDDCTDGSFWAPNDTTGVPTCTTPRSSNLCNPATNNWVYYNAVQQNCSIFPSWTNADFGAVGLAGSAHNTKGMFTLIGSGTNIAGAGDQFQFVWQPAHGDCSIQAQVMSVANVNAAAKAGVMIRNTLAADSAMAMVDLTPGSGVENIWRTNAGTRAALSAMSGITAPGWVKLTRTGNTFVGYYSATGATSWTPWVTNNITMSTSVYIGLAVCSVDNTTNCTATFTNILAMPAIPNSLTLGPVPDQTLVAGQTLTITNSATDADAPPLILTFSLLGSPTNANVNPTNGAFTWRPVIAQSPSTNPVSVMVEDNGTPPLSATNNFTVTVVKPANPVVSAVGMNHGQFNLTVNGANGPDYIVQTSTNLTTWLPLWTNSAAAPPFTFTDILTNANQQFYRVQLGP